MAVRKAQTNITNRKEVQYAQSGATPLNLGEPLLRTSQRPSGLSGVVIAVNAVNGKGGTKWDGSIARWKGRRS